MYQFDYHRPANLKEAAELLTKCDEAKILAGGQTLIPTHAIGSPPAVINAITDALGIKDIPMPATPARVWAAIQNSATPKAA